VRSLWPTVFLNAVKEGRNFRAPRALDFINLPLRQLRIEDMSFEKLDPLIARPNFASTGVECRLAARVTD
jgi:hypothetical protein